MAVEFDPVVPNRDPGFWGLKVNGGPVWEVIWCERKPILGFFSRVKPKALEPDPFPGIYSLEVVKVNIAEASSPELLAKSWSAAED